MKTRKTLFASFAFLFLGLVPILAMGQSMPHTFTANTAAKASEVNENFTYLLERFGGIRETTVNCGTSGTGSGINSAIQNGYNSIVINGVCKENITLDVTGSYGAKGNTLRLLKLRGANDDASQDKIIDNSSYTEHVLFFKRGVSVFIDNLTISGGDRTINTWANINLSIKNSKVEGYKNRGISLNGNSVMLGANLTIDGSYTGATTDEEGLGMFEGAVAYTEENLTITNNQKYGLTMGRSSIKTIGNVTLTGNGRAINVYDGAVFSSAANITISGSTDKAINVRQGHFHKWDGTISITNTPGNNFHAWMSNIKINNLTATGDGSTEESLVVINQSSSIFETLNISNSGKNGIESDSAIIYVDNLTAKNNKGDGIDASRTNLTVNNSTIAENDGKGIVLHNVSNLTLNSSIVSSTNDISIFASRGSFFDVKGTSVISSTNKEAIKIDYNSSGRIQSGANVTSTASNNGWGVWIRKGGLIEINSGSIIAGNSSAESINGELGAKIDIDYGATVQSVLCGNDNQTMVILNGSSGNYPTPTIGSNCITVKY